MYLTDVLLNFNETINRGNVGDKIFAGISFTYAYVSYFFSYTEIFCSHMSR